MNSHQSRLATFISSPEGQTFVSYLRDFENENTSLVQRHITTPYVMAVEIRKLYETHTREEERYLIIEAFLRMNSISECLELLRSGEVEDYTKGVLHIISTLVTSIEGSLMRELYTNNFSLVDNIISAYSKEFAWVLEKQIAGFVINPNVTYTLDSFSDDETESTAPRNVKTYRDTWTHRRIPQLTPHSRPWMLSDGGMLFEEGLVKPYKELMTELREEEIEALALVD